MSWGAGAAVERLAVERLAVEESGQGGLECSGERRAVEVRQSRTSQDGQERSGEKRAVEVR